MKIDQSANLAENVLNKRNGKSFLQDTAKAAGNAARAGNGTVKNGGIKAAGLNLFDDEISNRKQKAMKDAMQFVKDQYQADGEIEGVIEICRKKSAGSREILKEAGENLGRLEEEKEQMLEACGGEDTEAYKEYVKGYEEERALWTERKENAQKDITLQTATIRGVKQEILKHHGMDDADKAKEMMLEAAAKEITGMLVEEAREKIEEDIEDAVEKGEEKKEETEDMKGNLEEIQAELKKKAKEIEAQAEETSKNIKQRGGSNYHSLDMERVQREIERHNNEILKTESLLPEDLKGIMIDDIY